MVSKKETLRESLSTGSDAVLGEAEKTPNILVANRIDDIYLEFMHSLNTIYNTSINTYSKIALEYEHSVKENSTTNVKNTWEIYNTSLKATEGILEKDNRDDLYNEANKKYTDSIESEKKRFETNHNKTVENHIASTESARNEIKQQYADAFDACLQSVKDVWTNLATNTMDASTIAYMGQVLISMAYYKNWTLTIV